MFLSLPYEERLEYCDRPEQVSGPSEASWAAINAHLATKATSLAELITELSQRTYGHPLRVGDAFCGGGSIPFEAARVGCQAFATDLNPVAALLTWASINLIGGGPEVRDEVERDLRSVFDAVDAEVTRLGIEHQAPRRGVRERRGDAYLYCSEVVCPECGWRVPLSQSWLVGPTSRVVIRLVPDAKRRCFAFALDEDASEQAMKAAANGTHRDAELVCANPGCGKSTPIRAIRGDGRGSFGEARTLLRPWDNTDLVPRAEEIFRRAIVLHPVGRALDRRKLAPCTPSAGSVRQRRRTRRARPRYWSS